MEAVKQGSAAIGLRSNTYAVVATLKRSPSELSSHQKKVFEIDEHIGIAIAGAASLATAATGSPLDRLATHPTHTRALLLPHPQCWQS